MKQETSPAAGRPNDRQIADWNGRSGQSWVSHQAAFDTMLAAFGNAVMWAASARPGDRVLDIGCGAGGHAIDLAKRGCAVTAIDVSAPLLELARERAGELPITFIEGDASSYPFAPESFDLLFSRLGVMFFDDPAAAFAHLRSALRPGGRLACLAWRSAHENDGASIPQAAAAAVIGPLPPRHPDAPGPFSFGDRARVEGILAAAGFHDVALTPFDAPLLFGTGPDAVEDAVRQTFHIGPLTRLLAGQPQDVQDAICDQVRAAYTQKLTARGVELAGAAWIITAHI